MAVMIRAQGSTPGCPVDRTDTWDDFKQKPRQKKKKFQGFQTTESLKSYQRLRMKTSFSHFRSVRMRCWELTEMTLTCAENAGPKLISWKCYENRAICLPLLSIPLSLIIDNEFSTLKSRKIGEMESTCQRTKWPPL
jgi:hypothetical protein